MWLRRSWFVLLALALATTLLVSQPPSPVGATRSVYFPVTGHNVADPFLRYFQQHGGVPIFGLPLTEAFTAGGLTVQYFERARFELHPTNPPGAQVELGQLGRELSAGRLAEAPFKPLPGGAGFFKATGHTLQNGFAAFWARNGGLALFGYPLSEEFRERNPADGRSYTVQYFERARFEWHPEHAGTAAEVELGLLGLPAFQRHGYPAALLGKAQAAPPPQPRALTIPVLEYHDVGFGVGTYQVTLAAFVAQLDWLQANGYTTVTLDQAYDYLYEDGDLPPKPVILTFDDGRASQWNAVRELDARGMTGVFFVMGGGTGLSDEQLRRMVASGHEVEAHSMTHALLTGLSDAQLAYEVAGAKRALEAKLGTPINFFAYPYGAYDARVIDAVAAAGYRGGIAAWGGRSWTPEKRWREPRIVVSGYTTLDEFIQLVTAAR